jgi:hypothetical protein
MSLPFNASERKKGLIIELKEATALALKIIYHIFLDFTVIVTIILGFYGIKWLLGYLGIGNTSFINTLINYSESATLLVYLVFAGISIVGILRKEVLIKWINRDRDKGEGDNSV